MRLKKLCAALFVAPALGAVLASSAFAAATTTDVKWYTGPQGGEAELVGLAHMNASQVGSGFLNTTIGEANTPVELEFKRTECIACEIENVSGHADASGKLKFSEIKVLKPANCTTAATIETSFLFASADWMIGSANYVKLVPLAGEETQFATFKLEGTSCPLKTTFIPRGSLFVRSVNSTGTQSAFQRVNSLATINSEAGGNLHVAEKAMTLTATFDFSLASGAEFGTH